MRARIGSSVLLGVLTMRASRSWNRPAGSGRAVRASQRTGRALRSRQLVEQETELAQVAGPDQRGCGLVEIEDRARLGAAGAAGVERARLVERRAELRQVVGPDQGACGLRELRVALVPVAVVVVVALAAGERRPGVGRREARRDGRVRRGPAAVADVARLVHVGVELVVVRDRRAVVAGVAERVVVLVRLTRVADGRTEVGADRDSIAVRIQEAADVLLADRVAR